MRTSTAFFAGAGTIVAAIVIGVSGGLLMGDVMSAKSSKQGTETSRLERRMVPEPVVATASATPSVATPGRVSYLAPPQLPAAVAPVAPAPTPEARPQIASDESTPAAPVTAQPKRVGREQTVASEDDAASRARDADMKRTMDKRRAERHQQWIEKQRQRQLQEQQAAEDARAQDQAEPQQEMVAQPVRIELPFVRLFSPE